MADLDNDKEVNVKGIDTGKSDDYGTPIPKSKPTDVYKAPQKNQEFASGLGQVATTDSRSTVTGGTDFFVRPEANKLYATIDLAKGIPDPVERERYLAYNKGMMVQLMDRDKYGVRFDREIQDHAIYKQKLYDKNVKLFLDQLDENQGFLEAAGVTAGKLVGRFSLAATSIIPTVYGVGSALFNWDKSKLFNNTMFDFWETMEQGVDKHLAVYGGSGYTEGDKNIFARFVDNPMKALNNDIVPAVSFIAGAVATELLAMPLGAVTGGSALVANTARLGAQATNLFAKSYKLARGLETLNDANSMARIASFTEKYRSALGTTTGMVRSAGYESALIARDTYEQTYNSFLQKHEEINGRPPTDAEKVRYQRLAEDAGEQAWMVNIPLVGFSNMMQFPKIFAGGYKTEKVLSRLSPFKSTGTVVQDGIHVAKADVMSKWSRAGILGANMLKSGVTEGFEEFSQGVLQEGLVDYFTANYTKGSIESSVSYLNAMSTAARNYANSTEGQDSMTIGFLMGMLGIRLPIKIDEQTGKVSRSLKGQAFGGVFEAYRDTQKKWDKDRATAKYANDNPTINVLKTNFENMSKSFTTQQEMDEALSKRDIFTYKNKEHEQLHSFVETRRKSGIEDTIFQDIDALAKLPLDKFNEQFATKGVKEFTEETRTNYLTQLRKNVETTLKSAKEVESLFNDQEHLVDFWRKDFKALQNSQQLTEGIKDQMIYLHSANKNLAEREKTLTAEIQDITEGKVSLSSTLLSKGKVTSVDSETGKANVATTTREVYKAILEDWKENDPENYNMNVAKVAPLLQDLLSIKDRKTKVTELYKSLFTKSGAEKFAKFYDALEQYRTNEIQKILEKVNEEKIKNSKSEEAARNAKADEKSTTGTTSVSDLKQKQELEATDAGMRENLGLDGKTSSVVETIDSSLVMGILDGKPQLFNTIRERLEEKGYYIGTNFQELQELSAENPELESLVQAEYALLLKQLEEENSLKTVEQNFTEPETENQKESVEESEEEFGTFFSDVIEKRESIFEPGNQVTSFSIIPVLNDKEIKDGQLVRDLKTGRFIQKLTDQKIDLELVNSPDFLPNSKLRNEVIEATFKISDNEYNRTKNPSVENIAIDVYHDGVFIGRLPAYKEGMPSNFLALRQAIVDQQSVMEETTFEKESRKETIDEKFDTIIEQLAKAKVNVFFNDKNEFKKCD